MGTKKGKNRSLSSRQRTKHRIRATIIGSDTKPRFSVFKSSVHTYAQIISDRDGRTIVAASTLEKEVKDLIGGVAGENGKEKGGNPVVSTKSRNAAEAVGIVLARRGLAKDVKQVVFDRNGYKYCGRIKAVAEGARKGGFEF